MNKILQYLSLATIVILASCTRDNGSYAVISDRPVSLYNLATPGKKVASNVEASSSRTSILLIPMGKVPTIDSAIEELLQTYQGDYLANVQIEQFTGQLMFWYRYNKWTVRGDVMRNHP